MHLNPFQFPEPLNAQQPCEIEVSKANNISPTNDSFPIQKQEINLETLREIVKVKLKDDNGEAYYKKYNASDLKILKDAESEIVGEEESENLEELQRLEKLEEQDKEVENNEDIY